MKVLLFDLETSPNLGYTWGKWEQNVIQFKKEWELLSFAYKWLGETKVSCDTRLTYPREKVLVQRLWHLLNVADVIIAHNGDGFDNKKIKAKFVEHEMAPPSTYKTVDTKKIAKSQFLFNSNSLNDLGQTLKLGKKIETGGFDLWLKCMDGDKKAWAKMAEYNKQDVVLLEKVYLRLRAWYPSHPNLTLYENKEGCPACTSGNVHRRGYEMARMSKKARFQCQDCGHWFSKALSKAV